MERRSLFTVGGLAAAMTALVVTFGRAPAASADVRVPQDGADVVETLPFSANDPKRREVARLRRTVGADPNNLRAAVDLARLDIKLARERSDPRYLGHAQAALAPWWGSPDAPTEVLVLRATIEQSLHDFDAALADLDRVLARAPNDVQAWLTRATILTVRARYDEARDGCRRVSALGAPLAAVVCETQIDSVTGKAKDAHDRLATFAAASQRATADEEQWAVSCLAEYAARMGDADTAAAHFRRALELDPNDAYSRGAYADLLIDSGRFADAIELVKSHEANDALLLRLAIAERCAKLPGAEAHIEMLGARFDASRARGDVVHRREEARYWLSLRDDAERALELAKANWVVQNEPWDARIFVEAAAAANAPADAAPVRDHLQRTGLEGIR